MKRRSIVQPVPTGDATARYERLSYGQPTWYDLMPTPANATDGGTLAWPVFDGTAYSTIGQPAKLDFAGAFTVCAWVKQSIVAPQQGFERIISRDDIGANRSYLLSQIDNLGAIAGAFWSTNPAPPPAEILHIAQTGNSYLDGEWHFICVVNEGVGGNLIVYVDGVLAKSEPAGGVPDNDAVDWEFGRPQSGANDWFTGSIDTGRFYSRALSPDEILRDYHAGKPAHP